MNTTTTGRPLSDGGDPTDGPALELDPDGRTATNLRSRVGPLVSGPSSRIWGALLARPEDHDGVHPAFLGILAPETDGVPLHYHPRETETFEVLEGELTLTVEGEDRALGPGDELTVQPGQLHGFRNDADAFTAVVAEQSSVIDYEAQVTLFGMDHEGRLGSGGRPPLLHAAVLTAAMREDTVFASVPIPVQKALWVTVAPLGRAAGHRAVRERYLADEFWEAHVEQPDL